MSLLLLVGILGLLGGLVFLGIGAYALYEGFAKDEGGVWLGSRNTARVVGIVAVLVGLLLLCGLLVAGAFLFGMPFFSMRG